MPNTNDQKVSNQEIINNHIEGLRLQWSEMLAADSGWAAYRANIVAHLEEGSINRAIGLLNKEEAIMASLIEVDEKGRFSLFPQVKGERRQQVMQAFCMGLGKHSLSAYFKALPVNLTTGNHYSGVNMFTLFVSAHESPFWATYRQWRSIGYQVKKGSKGMPLMKVVTKKSDPDKKGEKKRGYTSVKRFYVFNFEQVEEIKEGS